MTKKLQEVMERVETWPEEKQKDAVRMLMAMEEQDKSRYHLTRQGARTIVKSKDLGRA